MIAFEDIATTGAPAVVAALGMGTVFTCLTILYLLMRLQGRVMPRFTGPAGTAKDVGGSSSADEAAQTPAPTSEETQRTERGGMVAAIAVALERHRRLARAKTQIRQPSGTDGWKMAGRVQALRKR
jgi:sodium pump decarboxylase gamma subunit